MVYPSSVSQNYSDCFQFQISPYRKYLLGRSVRGERERERGRKGDFYLMPAGTGYMATDAAGGVVLEPIMSLCLRGSSMYKYRSGEAILSILMLQIILSMYIQTYTKLRPFKHLLCSREFAMPLQINNSTFPPSWAAAVPNISLGVSSLCSTNQSCSRR